MSNANQTPPLAGRRIAVPESRELNLFTTMLEERGAEVYRCPLVAIRDAPDRDAVEAWLRDFAAGHHHDLILLTGEGLRRLLGFADRAGDNLWQDFIAALARVRKITRGPKPGNALRAIGLKADLTAAVPTTEGVMTTLAADDLRGRTIGVQLYGTNPNLPLVEFLSDKGARVTTVAPYIYADDSEQDRVEALVELLVAGGMDAIAFTSTPQVTRLFQVARRMGMEDGLRAGMNGLLVAAVGPVVADCLTEAGVDVDVMPDSTYFMKPLVRRLVDAFAHGNATPGD